MKFTFVNDDGEPRFVLEMVPFSPKGKRRIKATARKFFASCGFNSNLKGFEYMVAILEMCLLDSETVKLKEGVILERVRRKYRAPRYAVERDLRTVLAKGCETGACQKLCSLMGYEGSELSERGIKVGEFIKLIGNYASFFEPVE